MKQTRAKRMRAIEDAIMPTTPMIRVIRVVGYRPFNFWDVLSVTINGNITIDRKGNLKDYQTLIDLENEAKKVLETTPLGKRIIMDFNMRKGADNILGGVMPDDAINTHLSIDQPREIVPSVLHVHLPHNGRD